MSLFKLGKLGLDLAVDVRSTLEDALKAMPDQNMEPDSIANGLKNRGVQDREIEQSGVNRWLNRDIADNELPKPKDILEWVKRTRQDKYSVHEIRGTPSGNRTNIDDLAAEVGDEPLENMTPAQYLGNIVEGIQDGRIPAEDLPEGWLERLRDAVHTAEEIEVDGNIDRLGSVLDRYGFIGEEDYQFVDEAITNLDAFVETVHRAQGREAALAFEQEVLTAGSRSKEQILRAYDFDVDDLVGIEGNFQSYVEEIRRQDGNRIAQRFETEFLAARVEGQVIEPLGVTLQPAELLVEADTELRRLADNFGTEAPDVNDQAAVNEFIHELTTPLNPDIPLDPEIIRPINEFHAAYTQLRQAIDAGEGTIDIPNFNTRIIDPNTPMTFSDNAYRGYALPNTNDASYAVRIYKNKAVDTKGFNYVEHFPGEAVNGGTFHTRTDVIQNNEVLRIQEIQSDIQNAMTKQKTRAIANWRNSSFKLRIFDITPTSDNPEAIEILSKVNDNVLKLLDAKGIRPNHGDVSDVLESTFRTDIYESMSELLHPDDLSNLQSFTQHWLGALKITSNSGAMSMPETVAKDLAENTDLSLEQVKTIGKELETFPERYKLQVEKELQKHTDKAEEIDKLRISPKERQTRIQLGTRNATVEEQILQARSIVDATELVNNKYGLDLLDTDIKNQSQLREAITEAVMDSPLDTIADNVLKQMNTPPVRVRGQVIRMSRGTEERIKTEINNVTDKGINYIQASFPDKPDILAIAKEATDEATKTVKEGMKELTPLEKFPDANKFDLDIPWRKQGIQNEVVRAIENGQKEVWLTVKPEGTSKLVRDQKTVQPAYETGGSINKTFRAVAKRFGAKVVEEDGYLKMKLAAIASSGVTLPLYADTNRQDFIIEARERGLDDATIAAFLEEKPIKEVEQSHQFQEAINRGIDPAVAKKFEHERFIQELNPNQFAEHPGIESDLPTIDGSIRYDKLPFDTIKEIAIELEVDPSTPSGIDQIYEEAIYKNNPGLREANQKKAGEFLADEARSDIADFIELNDYWQPFNWAAGKLGWGLAEEVYRLRKAQIARDVVEIGKEHGYDLIAGQGQEVGNPPIILEEDRWYVNVNGNVFDATPGILASLAREGGEIGISIGGGTAAALAVDRYTKGWEAFPPTRLMKFGAVTAGFVAGAVFGDQVDYATAAIRQHEEYNWSVALDKALGSAQLAVVGEVLGLAGITILKSSARHIIRAYNTAANGNIDGAYDILLRSLDVTDEQAQELVRRWESVNQKQAPVLADKRGRFNPRNLLGKPDKEKAIAILPVTRAGGEHIIPAIAEKNPRASAAIVSEINQRAKSLVRAASGEIDKSGKRIVAQEIIDGIGTYKADVEDFYNVIKQQGGDLAPTGYGWDMDTMAIKPLVEDLISKIYRDGPRKAAMNMLKRIDKLTTGRTFEDLIELRQLMNKVRSGRSLGKGEHEAFQNIMGNIDNEIEDVSRRMGPGGEQWAKDWTTAKADYSEMKKLTNNALSKILQRPGISDEVVAKALVKYGTALDGTYDNLIKRLPLDVQPNVEALIIDNLVEKFTDGNITQLQATNFPELSRALADYDFVWPRSRSLRRVVDTFAEIYQNDNALSYVSGGISTTKFQSYLTTDPVIRAKFEIASGFFNQIKILMGGPKGDAAALIKASAKLLEDPLNPHNVERALAAVEDDSILQSAIKKLSAETAASRHLGRPGVTGKVKIFRDKSGRLWTKDGKGRTAAEGIPMHRMTNEEVATKVSQAKDVRNLSEIEKARLIDAGFVSIGLDDGTVIILN